MSERIFDRLYPDIKSLTGDSGPPRFDAKHILINGELREWKGEFRTVTSPIFDRSTGTIRSQASFYTVLNDFRRKNTSWLLTHCERKGFSGGSCRGEESVQLGSRRVAAGERRSAHSLLPEAGINDCREEARACKNDYVGSRQGKNTNRLYHFYVADVTNALLASEGSAERS
jgi:hypothetical protein